MKRGKALLIGVLALGLAAAPAEAASAGDAAPAGAGSSSGAFYWIALDGTAAPGDLAKAARAASLRVVSARHSGASTGEILVGDMPLETAMTMYEQTNVEEFGHAPAISSFVATAPLPPGARIGDARVASVQTQTRESLDPTPGHDGTSGGGDVGSANIENPWAPSHGTLWGYNSASGAPRRVKHRLTWDSSSGLNSYQTSDAEFAYEHDHKQYDPDPYGWVAPNAYGCKPEFWMEGDTRIVSSNMPSSAGAYADNARASDECGERDITFGVFNPEKLSINTFYTVVVGGDAGKTGKSTHGLLGQKLLDSCPFGVESSWCVNLRDHPRSGSNLFINRTRKWTVPGCYTWYRSSSPVSGRC